MKRTAYEIRKGRDGYAIFELVIVNKSVVSETKIHEYDFLVITLNKLAQHLQIICPDLIPEKSSTPDAKAEAPSVKTPS
jgi:hypothetical protein